MRRCCLGALALLLAAANLPAAEGDLATALAKVRAVQPLGEGHREAVAAAHSISQAPVAQLPQILAAMDGANPIATNWLRVAAEGVAQHGQSKLPVADLENFLAETKHSPRARRLAYEMVAAVDPTAEKRLIPTLLDDPSLELRRDAVAQILSAAAGLTDKQAALARFQKAFFHARDLDQIKEATDKLKALGERPDIATHMGFVMGWKLIGPFDNAGDKGWDTAYPPETKIDLAAEYDGQKGKVKWIDHATSDEYGLVDLNKALANHKGAVAYAYAAFMSDRDRPCELRLGCITANKVWLNGQLVSATHVYHANTAVDQYVARGPLKKGNNAMLLKICQNEQTEVWAQNWQFQLRVCDAIGTAILSQDRPAAKVAAAE